jgi:hypothetical protein
MGTVHTITTGRVERTDHSFIRTYSGAKFWPLDPRAEEITLEDVAHHLALECRFQGATSTHYSVADHALRVSRLAEWMVLRDGRTPAHFELAREVALWGLHHDDSEAYLKDLPTPVKHSPGLGELYRELERNMMDQIIIRFELMPHEPQIVKVADQILCNTEGRDLVKGFVTRPGIELLEDRITPLTAEAAEFEFIRRHDAIMLARQAARALKAVSK